MERYVKGNIFAYLSLIVFIAIPFGFILVLNIKFPFIILVGLLLLLFACTRYTLLCYCIITIIFAFPLFASMEKLVNVITFDVFKTNITYIEMLIFFLLGVSLFRKLAQKHRHATENKFTAITLIIGLVFMGVIVGRFNNYRSNLIGNDVRAFFAIFLYFPLRTIILDNLWNRTLKSILTGAIILFSISIIIYIFIPNFIIFLNEGTSIAGTTRLFIGNAFPVSVFFSSFLLVLSFSNEESSLSKKIVLLVLFLFALYIYGVRALAVVCIMQIPIVLLLKTVVTKEMSLDKSVLIFVGVLLLLVIGFSLITKSGLFNRTTIEKDDSLFTRLETYNYLSGLMLKRPFFGYGFGWEAPLLNFQGIICTRTLAIDSLYFYLIIKTGFIGLLAFLSFVFMLLRKSYYYLRRNNNNPCLMVFFVYGISVLVNGFVSSAVIKSPAGWLLFVIWTIYLEKISRETKVS